MRAAIVTAVGRCRATSCAKEGPDRIAASALGAAAASTSVINRPLAFSIPLAQITTGAPGTMSGAAASRTGRKCWAGTTTSTASAPAALARS